MPTTHYYRYQTCAHLEWLKRIMLRHEIYFPTTAQLNDPNEGCPRFAKAAPRDVLRFVRRAWESLHPNATLADTATFCGEAMTKMSTLGEDWFRKETASLYYRLSAFNRILSMSRRWDNMSLWATYAASHSGYCLEFVNEGIFAKARQVEYGDILELDPVDTDAICDAFFSPYRKGADWRNEEEVRVVIQGLDPAYQRIEPEWLTRIILGKEVGATQKTRILQWAAARKPALAVAQATYDVMEQRLVLVS